MASNDIERYKLEKNLDFLLEYNIVLVKYPDVKSENYDILAEIIRGRITVYDEAHKLKNPDTQLVRMLTHLTNGQNAVKAKWGMTATAIGNDILDLWGIFHFLDSRIFGTEWDFKKNYCIMEEKVEVS